MGGGGSKAGEGAGGLGRVHEAWGFGALGGWGGGAEPWDGMDVRLSPFRGQTNGRTDG